MHADKFISTLAIILNIIAWEKISLIAGAVLAVVMTIYYVINIIQKLNNNGKNKGNR